MRNICPRNFRFSLPITGTAIILSGLMLIAARWQWTRYNYKVRLLESYRINATNPSLPFPNISPNSKKLPELINFVEKKVQLEGVFDYDHQLIVTNREGQIGQGVGPGHLLVTPLLLNKGSGPAILVVRGFIPFSDRSAETWQKYSFFPAEVKIDAVGQLPVYASLFGPKNPKTLGFQKIWFFEDIPKMAAQLPYPTLSEVYFQKIGLPPHGEFPREAIRIQVPPTTHFGYTIEWCLLAIVTWAIAILWQCSFLRRPTLRYSEQGNIPNISAGHKCAMHFFIFWLLFFCVSAANATPNPQQVQDEVGIIQRLHGQISFALPFRDEKGNLASLADFALPGKPTILVPVYYFCPRLCTLTLNGVIELLNSLKLRLGEDFSVLAFSINPNETPELARKKAENYYQQLHLPNDGLPERGFRFLTGDSDSIRTLTKELGFIYQQDGNDYAHAPGIMLITPEGIISRYFLGVQYDSSDVRYSLIEASAGKIGTLSDQVFLYCFRFDPTKGKYTPAAWNLMRVVSAVVVLMLGGFLFVLWRRDLRRSVSTKINNDDEVDRQQLGNDC